MKVAVRLRRFAQRLRGIAVIGSDFARRLGEREILLAQGVARYLGRVGFVPFDDQGVPALSWLPRNRGRPPLRLCGICTTALTPDTARERCQP